MPGSPRGPGILIEEILTDDSVHLGLVHPRVEADEQVPEPRHLYQSRLEIVVDNADLGHDRQTRSPLRRLDTAQGASHSRARC
jgi:hypothetical protein